MKELVDTTCGSALAILFADPQVKCRQRQLNLSATRGYARQVAGELARRSVNSRRIVAMKLKPALASMLASLGVAAAAAQQAPTRATIPRGLAAYRDDPALRSLLSRYLGGSSR